MIHSSVQQQQQQQQQQQIGDEKTVDDMLGLQRFYHLTTNDTNKKRISIQMQDTVEEQVHVVPVKQTSTEMSAIHMLLDRDIKKALWVNDPLRLNIEEEEQEVKEEQEALEEVQFPFDGVDKLPFKFKLKSRQVQANLLESLYVSILNNSDFDQEYLDLTMELPFATAAIFPPTPPPKPVSCTPAMPPPTILPLHMYEIIQEQQEVYNNDWLYTRDEDQSTLMTYSPRISTTANSTSIYFHEESNFTEETWDAIFHPLSTFKPNKGELEYYAWNPMNLPVAAARVAQRVLPSRTYTFHEDMATIPQLAPTPPLKPSPVLTLDDDSDHIVIMDEHTTPRERYYFDMLHEIRGNQRSFSVSSLGSNTLGEATESTPTSLFHSFFNKKKPIVEQHKEYYTQDDQSINIEQDPENALTKEDTRYWTGNKLFIAGFICPFVWIYATFYLRNTSHPNDIHWQKRCRLASIYFSLVISVVVMVIGVKSIGAAGARQTTSDTIRAVIAN